MTNTGGTPVLVIHPHSATWRRRLSPLAWAALEHVALAAHPDHEGWVAPIGVRNIAASLGVTKDTAARAVTTLAAAGLVTRQHVTTPDGRRRSGYQLNLPDGLELRVRPEHQDATPRRQQTDPCPEFGDTPTRPTNSDSAPSTTVALPARLVEHFSRHRPPGGRPAVRSPAAEAQRSLFDPPPPPRPPTPTRAPLHPRPKTTPSTARPRRHNDQEPKPKD